MKLSDLEIIDIPEFRDSRGGLSFIEKNILSFKIKRIFYLYDVPNNAIRGGHAHVEHLTVLIALNGSFDVTLIDQNEEKRVITLSKPNKGVLIPNMIWHEVSNFSNGAICLVIASDIHKEEDYIRDFQDFITF